MKVKKLYDEIFFVVATLVSASSLVSLMQSIWCIGLASSLAGIIEFYRDKVGPFFVWLYFPFEWMASLFSFQWKVPEWLRDLHTLSFVGASMMYRARTMKNPPPLKRRTFAHRLAAVALAFLFVLFNGLLGMGLVWFGAIVATALWMPVPIALIDKPIFRRIFYASLVAVVVFYVLNWELKKHDQQTASTPIAECRRTT